MSPLSPAVVSSFPSRFSSCFFQNKKLPKRGGRFEGVKAIDGAHRMYVPRDRGYIGVNASGCRRTVDKQANTLDRGDFVARLRRGVR